MPRPMHLTPQGRMGKDVQLPHIKNMNKKIQQRADKMNNKKEPFYSYNYAKKQNEIKNSIVNKKENGYAPRVVRHEG